VATLVLQCLHHAGLEIAGNAQEVPREVMPVPIPNEIAVSYKGACIVHSENSKP
jgi:hypothetical protein